jgi:hypothetical protein
MTAPYDDPDHRPERLTRLTDHPVPSRALEERVVQSLTAGGTLRSTRPWLVWPLAAAAALGLFVAGRQSAPSGTEAAGAPPGARWMLLLYEDEAFEGPAPGHEDAYVAEYRDWALALQERHQLVDGAELLPTRVLLEPDGAAPSPEPASPLGALTGYFIIVAPTLEDARVIARTNPHLKHRGRVAIQPLGAS